MRAPRRDESLSSGAPGRLRAPHRGAAPASTDGSTPAAARPVVLVVGGGFAGFHALRRLERILPPEAAELVLVTPGDHLVYTPLLPQVAAGVLEPRHLAVSLHAALRRTRIVPGRVVAIGREARTVAVERSGGGRQTIGWVRILVGPGTRTRTFAIPGVAEHGHGLKSLAEAVYVRDAILDRLAAADAAGPAGTAPGELTFVVAGGGYTGTEMAAQGRLLNGRILRHYPRIAPSAVRWVLLEREDRLLAGMSDAMARAALRALRARGVEVRLGRAVESVTPDAVRLAGGEAVPTRTLIWAAGVAASPLVATLGLPLEGGRLVVGADLRAPGDPDVFAVGDAAAVPDLTKGGRPAGQTAQHAERQGRAAARNLAASLRGEPLRQYRHHDLGFAVDLGGWRAVAQPVGVPLAGLPAMLVTRAYHLKALPSAANRLRVALDWVLEGVTAPLTVRLGFVPEAGATLASESAGVAPPPPGGA